MRIFRCVHIVVLLAVLAGLPACTSAPMNRQEAVDWYTNNAAELTWVGYQGTDKDYHYFAGRTKKGWAFIRVRKNELTMEDERTFTSIYRYPVYYYLVDPTQDYKKIDGSEPNHSDD